MSPCARTSLPLSLALTVQIKGLWTGQGEGRGGRKGEGSESMGVLNKGKGGNSVVLWRDRGSHCGVRHGETT